MNEIFVNIMVIINEIPSRKMYKGRKLSYLDQFVVLYYSIKKNWKFPNKINLCHSQDFSKEWLDVLMQLDIDIIRLSADEDDNQYYVRPYCYLHKMKGTHKLILDCDMVALENPTFDLKYDAMGSYGGYYYNKWRELCNYLGCKYPEYPIRYKSPKNNKYHALMQDHYHLIDDDTKYFPFFNNGAIMIKEKMSYKVGAVWKGFRKKMDNKYFCPNMLTGGEMTIGLAINHVTDNWGPLPRGFNLRVSAVARNLLRQYKGPISLLHYTTRRSVPSYIKRHEKYFNVLNEIKNKRTLKNMRTLKNINVDIMIPIRKISSGKKFNGRQLSQLDQLLILYHSIKRNWTFPNNIYLLHSFDLSNNWSNLLNTLDIKTVKIKISESDEFKEHIKPYCYMHKTQGTHKLILNVNTIAIATPKIDLRYDILAAYGGFYYNRWKELCEAIGCKMPKDPIKYRLPKKNNKYHGRMIEDYYLTNMRERYFPYFNNGAIFIKNELSHTVGKLYLEHRAKIYENRFTSKLHSGQMAIGLTINKVTDNWGLLSRGFNFMVSNLTTKVQKEYGGNIYLLHYIHDTPYLHQYKDYLDVLDNNRLSPINMLNDRSNSLTKANEYKYYFGVSMQFRNEKPYLKEWIDFHLLMGADILFLFDDRSEDNPEEVLDPYINKGKVIYEKVNKYKLRWQNIKRIMIDYKNIVRWIAVLDIDEFLYPTRKEETIKDVLKEFDDEGIKAIYVNWLGFGSNGHVKYEEKSVLERFTKRSEYLYGMNSAGKSIIQPAIIESVKNSHIFPLKKGYEYYNDTKEKKQNTLFKTDEDKKKYYKYVEPYFNAYGINLKKRISTNKRNFNCPRNYPPTYDRLCINHYTLKSEEEFLGKLKKCDNKMRRRYTIETFKKLDVNLNAKKDLTILNVIKQHKNRMQTKINTSNKNIEINEYNKNQYYNMNIYKNILITGGCGFIGSNFTNYIVSKYPAINFINIDKLDYCANLDNITVTNNSNYTFIKGDILDNILLLDILTNNKIDVIIHFAAHSHVDNSFIKPNEFIINNILGTQTLLEACRQYNKIKRFIHVSTDEVYGELETGLNKETDRLNPSNPYAATKAGAEHIVRAYYKSYDIPIIITRGNNAYGPRQYPEKLIPKFINALRNNEKCTIHGDGQNKRNFIYIDDLIKIYEFIIINGQIGETYNMGTDNEYSVLQATKKLINKIKNTDEHDKWITYVKDRYYNDKRYAITNNKLKKLGLQIETTNFDKGLQLTIDWYYSNI